MARIHKLTVPATLLAALLAVIMLLPQGCGKKADDEIVIGAVLPLTGPAARYGNFIQEGLELGRSEINAAGGINGQTLTIVYEDDQAEPTRAASAMRKLVESTRVPIVFGSWASSCVLAQAPIAEESHTVLFAEAISPKIRDAGDYVFRIQPDARFYIREFVPFIRTQLKIARVAVLYVNNDFGLDQADVFRTEFEGLGGTVLAMEGFEQGATDFKTELSKVTQGHPEAIFCPAYTEIAIILRQARELGITLPFLASIPFENPDILVAAGDAAEGVFYPHHFDPYSEDSVVTDFRQKYVKEYARDPEGFAALAYDGIMILSMAMTECGNETECLRDFLYNVQDYQGVTGLTAFDDHGDVAKPIIIKTVRGGRFERYK